MQIRSGIHTLGIFDRLRNVKRRKRARPVTRYVVNGRSSIERLCSGHPTFEYRHNFNHVKGRPWPFVKKRGKSDYAQVVFWLEPEQQSAGHGRSSRPHARRHPAEAVQNFHPCVDHQVDRVHMHTSRESAVEGFQSNLGIGARDTISNHFLFWVPRLPSPQIFSRER